MKITLFYLFALAPIITIFLLLVIAGRPAKLAMPIAYLVTTAIALLIWQAPFSVIRELDELYKESSGVWSKGKGKREKASFSPFNL